MTTFQGVAGAAGDSPSSEELGTFCLVLHSHLPWLAHHGAWPVGEEWLHQSWADSYARVVDVAARLESEGRRRLFTLGITPVLAAQLDDGYLLAEHERWLHDRLLRAVDLASSPAMARRSAGHVAFDEAQRAITLFDRRWRSGGSPVLRSLQESGAIEILGGPLSHTFAPDLPRHIATATLNQGLEDGLLRRGQRATGVWTPECGYEPGLAQIFADAGVTHLMLEGPTMQSAGATTSSFWLLEDSDVAAIGRDLEVTYRVWSPRRGYPGGRWYRDFHTFDHDSGLRISRVTGKEVPSASKALYDVERAYAAVLKDARDFVEVVRASLARIKREQDGTPGIVVAAYDTELFGHWWHEGPQWLELILRMLPSAGVRVTTLEDALSRQPATQRVHPRAGSWGSGKDFRVWSGEESLLERRRLQSALHRVMQAIDDNTARHGNYQDPVNDQLVTSLLLALASDWVFMIAKDSAADYARARINGHLSDVDALLEIIQSTESPTATRDVLTQIEYRDRPWGHLDARTFICPAHSR